MLRRDRDVSGWLIVICVGGDGNAMDESCIVVDAKTTFQNSGITKTRKRKKESKREENENEKMREREKKRG